MSRNLSSGMTRDLQNQTLSLMRATTHSNCLQAHFLDHGLELLSDSAVALFSTRS